MKTALCALILLAGLLIVTYWLTPAAPIGEAPEMGYIDMHVHVGCMGISDNDCFVSPSIEDSYKFGFYLKAFDTNEDELEAHGDEVIVKKLSAKIAASKWIDKAVVLAMDGIIDTEGALVVDETQVYIPNEYVVEAIAGYDNLLYGASINPNRVDALSRLEQAKRDGAVLVKWIPCIMGIDPAAESLLPFYQKLIELEMPLLTHAGQERSFAHSRDELCDPQRLARPLELGVTVIAAHIATTGKNDGIENFERIMPMFERYSNLYTDISSLTQINKLGYLRSALEIELLHSRMIFGSDWPLQMFPLVSPWYHADSLSFRQAKAVQQLDNQWDRDVVLKRFLGVPEFVFRRSRRLLLP